jgi:predicted  nucleic acid-binding Zn-ribbon protein
MSENRFTFLLDLVSLDQEVGAAEKKRASLLRDLEDAGRAKQALFDREHALKQQVHDTRKNVDLLELDMKACDTRETQNKKQLDTIHSLKEYNGLRAELDAVHEEQQQVEQDLLVAWNKLEQAQLELQVYTKELPELVTTSEEKIASTITEEAELGVRLTELIAQRPSREQGVPPEWLEKYIMMRAQVPDPVVPLMDGACSVCFNHVTMQDVLRIQRGALMQCKGCYRLLYTLDMQ